MFKKSKVKAQKSKVLGFTLVELLVVIAIISILASLLLANFVGLRQRARDAQRKSDLQQIRSALELYRADNGAYPLGVAPNYYIGVCGTAFTYNSVTYMSKISCDPLGSGIVYNSGNYGYVSADGTSYTLYACLENANDNDSNSVTITGANCTTDRFYRLINP